MAPFIHLDYLRHLPARPRSLGAAAIVAGSLLAIALGQAHGQPHAPPAAPRHAAVTIQRAVATAAGQIARPPAPARAIPLASWHSGGNTGGGDHHHGHKGGG
ncbi:MAG TPA: hypothetical protein VGR57_20680 [Ktedonobacterales bacterium]|nr:hypothetical protein [Ktedonobacterales bacterium]